MTTVSPMSHMPYDSPPGLAFMDVEWPADQAHALAVIFRAAFVLEREGRLALRAPLFGVGGAMRQAAAALRRVDDILRELGPSASAETRYRAAAALVRVCDDATASLGRLAGFIHWKRALLADHAVLLRGLPVMVMTGELISREHWV